MGQPEDANRPHWRVMLDAGTVEFIAVCVRPLDEVDYDQERFLTGPIYDEAEAERRADYANYLMPKYLRTKQTIRVIKEAHRPLEYRAFDWSGTL